jgi:hypothetical protein
MTRRVPTSTTPRTSIVRSRNCALRYSSGSSGRMKVRR